MGPGTSLVALHLFGLSLANICVCTRRYTGMHTYYAGMHTYASSGWAVVHKTTYAPMLYTAPCLKVPKCEIFHLFDFNEFYGVKSLLVGDLRDEIKNYFF